MYILFKVKNKESLRSLSMVQRQLGKGNILIFVFLLLDTLYRRYTHFNLNNLNHITLREWMLFFI